MSAHQALGTLRNASAQPLPANVEREIAGWFERCRRVTAQRAWLLHCPDEETASRILEVAGEKVYALSPSVLEILDDQLQPTLKRKLNRAGVFIDYETYW